MKNTLFKHIILFRLKLSFFLIMHKNILKKKNLNENSLGFQKSTNRLHCMNIYINISLEEPCAGCARPYGFKHAMTLSTDTRSFSVSQNSQSKYPN